jgi:Domain of unknown function (DUF4134)
MLHFISWGRFFTTLFGATALYYLVIIWRYYRKEAWTWLRKRLGLRVGLAIFCLLGYECLQAQDGNQGINQANTMIRGYFQSGVQLMYGIAAVLALVGAIRTYREWNSGHQQEAYRCAAGWFGSVIFIIVVATVIQSFFGL